ncbi:hypothetical protein YC2023_054353 [Brassica napus]
MMPKYITVSTLSLVHRKFCDPTKMPIKDETVKDQWKVDKNVDQKPKEEDQPVAEREGVRPKAQRIKSGIVFSFADTTPPLVCTYHLPGSYTCRDTLSMIIGEHNHVLNWLSATTRRDPPILAFGHMTAFLHLSNKLAEKGHEIVFLLPKKALDQVKPLNLYPNLITFHTQSRACGGVK